MSQEETIWELENGVYKSPVSTQHLLQHIVELQSDWFEPIEEEEGVEELKQHMEDEGLVKTESVKGTSCFERFKEKPKKIEKLEHGNLMQSGDGIYEVKERCNELIEAVNYLLEKD